MRSHTITLALLLLLTACGDPVMKVTDASYEPRIVVEGLLLPGYPVRGIRVTRNFPVDYDLSRNSVLLPDAAVSLRDDDAGVSYPLSLREGAEFKDYLYEYAGSDLTIVAGGTYTLQVTARVDGRDLSTRATTTVPQAGFRIRSVNQDRLAYRPVGDDGEVVDVQLEIERSPGTTFYFLSSLALDAAVDSFVYDNPFVDEKPDKLSAGDLLDYSYNYEWIQNTPPTAGTSTMNLFWWDLWFYGRHRVIVYAADLNYSRFLQTFDSVQEDDGNFHEPVFSLDGDGIGYFGSAIPDTVFVEVLR